jgi:hypothetical protein
MSDDRRIDRAARGELASRLGKVPDTAPIGCVAGFEGKLVFDNEKPDGTPRKLMFQAGWALSAGSQNQASMRAFTRSIAGLRGPKQANQQPHEASLYSRLAANACRRTRRD